MGNVNKVEWNYISNTKKSTGYEGVMPTLLQYTQKRYLNASPSEQNNMVEEVFAIYREKNIFPIYYFSADGVREEIRKVFNKDVSFDGKTLNVRNTQGSAVCKWFNPNLFDVVVRGNEMTQWKRFYDDVELKKAIAFCLRYDTGVKPSQVQAGLRMTSSVATNFSPMRAKAIYEYFTPDSGVIYDPSHGFGGRLLGALGSRNNYKYIGVDPAEETFKNVSRLGFATVEALASRPDAFETYMIGSEEFKPDRNSLDFAFTSPPYFTLEEYSDDEGQSVKRFPELDAWLDGFVRETVANVYNGLKFDRYMAINIADFRVNGKAVSYVNEYIKIAQQEGFTYVGEVAMNLQRRTGNRNKGKLKSEGIFIFRKGV